MHVAGMWVGWALALVVSGCVGSVTLVTQRAAEDLHCPETHITVIRHEMGSYEAQGCGNAASYVVRGGEVMPDASGHDDLPTSMPKGND